MTNQTLIKTAMLCKAAYEGIKVGDHSFIVDTNGDRTVIAMAGTANLENVFEDASVWPRRTPTDKFAHAGVMNAFDVLECTISHVVVKSGPVVFAGHSLGGGIAQIFAEKFNCEVVTFGSLKTYFRFYGTKNLLHTRVICDHDPVPMVPGLFYTHNAKPLVLYANDGEWIDIEDHYLDNYINLLEGLK